MLTIHMPEGHQDKHKRRRRRALAYLPSGLIIMACCWLAIPEPLWIDITTGVITGWWTWAVLTDPDLS